MLFIILFGIVSLFSDMTHEGASSIRGAYLSLLGASAAMLSGSGASVYGIFETQEIADRIISNVKAKRHAKR